MINIETVVKDWETDSVIDKFNLDETTIKGAKLHSKYLDLYTKAKLELKALELRMDELRKNKWLWYHAKLTKEQMDELGWKYDPFDGMAKPLKSDLPIFMESDPDVVKLKAKIEYGSTCVEVLKEIMDTLRWRHTNIKNIIDYLRFTAGS